MAVLAAGQRRIKHIFCWRLCREFMFAYNMVSLYFRRPAAEPLEKRLQQWMFGLSQTSFLISTIFSYIQGRDTDTRFFPGN